MIFGQVLYAVEFVSGAHRQVSWSFMVAPPPIELANLGMADSLILMVLALVVFGPRRLPHIGRQIGQRMYEFRKASNDFKFQMEEELRSAEDADRRKKEEAERQRNLALTAPPEANQTIEAQAGIGAAETPVASPDSASPSLASPYPGEGTYPAAYPPETATVETMPVVAIPRIQPPQTGEQVSAASPTAAAKEETPADLAPPATADVPNGAEPNNPTAEPPTEPVSQHG